jgi:hypothetical protein
MRLITHTAALLIAAFVVAGPARAADHLEPFNMTIASRQALVQGGFSDAIAPEVRVRGFVIPSFDREFAVGIAEKRGRQRLFVLAPGAKRVSRCEILLPRRVAERSIDAWRAMLFRVRKPAAPTVGLNGVTYVYSMEADGTTLAGQTWSPDPKTPPGMLMRMTYTMREYCLARRPDHLRELERLAGELLTRVQADGA